MNVHVCVTDIWGPRNGVCVCVCLCVEYEGK